MKAVLMSIKPYWVFLIISKAMGWSIGEEKTIEVRKSYPKDANWDKVVKIYCSKDKKSFAKIPKEYQPLMQQFLGKVIGEFVCDEIDTYDDDTIHAFSTEDYSKWNDFDLYNSCIHPEDLEHYANDDWLYGWHISDLVIYDKPKELSEFIRICPEWIKGKITDRCLECEHLYTSPIDQFLECDYEGEVPITKPPQSWCYVEEME